MKKNLAFVLLFVILALSTATLAAFALTAEGSTSEQTETDKPDTNNPPKAVEMQVSALGIELIKNFEGYSQMPYKDYSHWSIGYGSYVCSIDDDPLKIYPNGISIMEAEEMLLKNVVGYANAVNKFAIANNVILTQNQFDALTSFTYNLGKGLWNRDPENFQIKRLLLEGDYTPEEMTEAFYLWRNAGGKENEGLKKRRLREAALFNSTINVADPAADGYDVKYYIINTSLLGVKKEPNATSDTLGSLRRNVVIPILYTDESGKYGFTTYAAYLGWVEMSKLLGVDEKGTVTLLDDDPEDGTENDFVDGQGIKYTLDHINLKAYVGDLADTPNNSGYAGINNGYVYITKYVVYDNRVYTMAGIGNKAFASCESIDKIYIPGTVESIAENAFEGSSLKIIYYDDGSFTEDFAKNSIYQAIDYRCVISHKFGEFYDVHPGDLENARKQEKKCSVCSDTEERIAVSMSVISYPSKTEYYEGDPLDLSGLKVVATFSDGEQFDVTELITSHGYDSAVIGDRTLTLRYSIFETIVNVKIVQKMLVGITVIKTPIKTTFVEGTEFDFTGLSVVSNYNNGTSESISEYELSKCDINTVGKQTVTVTYNGFKAAFSITVKAKTLTGITLLSPPSKLEYYCGEEFDFEGTEMLAKYDNGTENTVTEGFTVKKYDNQVPGTVKVRIYYGKYYKSVNVTVILNRLVSDKYGIDADDSCLIEPMTTVEDFKAAFEASERIRIKNIDGKEIKSGFVGSGFTAELWYNEDLLASIAISVSGDMNGDGKMSYADYMMISAYFTKIDSVYSDTDKEICDLNSDGEITLADLICMLSEIKTKNEDE